MKSAVQSTIDLATGIVKRTGKKMLVYRLNGRVAMLPLDKYKLRDMDAKGAERICGIRRLSTG
jgi:hypothetical protein